MAQKALAKVEGVSTFRLMEESQQLTQYLPVLMLGTLAVLFVAFMLVGSMIVGKLGKRSRI